MELTPEAVRRAEFGRAWGGYDMREVDTFLAEVGNGVDGLHARIREVTLRAERAESRGGGGLDDTIKRTLTLAQRAADLVVSEAKGVAERTTADAAASAARTRAEADADAAAIRARAEADGATIIAEHLARAQQEHAVLWAQLQAERAVIEEQHRRTRDEVAAMHGHAQVTRDQLRASLADHLTRLDMLEFDDPSRFTALDLPELRAVSAAADVLPSSGGGGDLDGDGDGDSDVDGGGAGLVVTAPGGTVAPEDDVVGDDASAPALDHGAPGHEADAVPELGDLVATGSGTGSEPDAAPGETVRH